MDDIPRQTLATLQINTRWFLGTYSYYWLVEPVDVIDESLRWMNPPTDDCWQTAIECKLRENVLNVRQCGGMSLILLFVDLGGVLDIGMNNAKVIQICVDMIWLIGISTDDIKLFKFVKCVMQRRMIPIVIPRKPSLVMFSRKRDTRWLIDRLGEFNS